MRVRIAVSFELPEGADRQDALAYVTAAVGAWKGSLRPQGGYGPDDPGDPMFYLDASSLRCTTKTRKGIYRCDYE